MIKTKDFEIEQYNQAVIALYVYNARTLNKINQQERYYMEKRTNSPYKFKNGEEAVFFFSDKNFLKFLPKGCNRTYVSEKIDSMLKKACEIENNDI